MSADDQMGKTLHLHPVAIMIAISAGTLAFGLVGTFVAVPIAAIAASVIDTYTATDVVVTDDQAHSEVLRRPRHPQLERQ